jgi:GTPase involved in cell partitioning and DNA repair
MKNVTDTLQTVDVSYLIERLTRLETEIQGIKEDSYSDDSWMVENKVDTLETEVARLQVQFETVKRQTDDHVWTISDLQTKLIYLEQQFYALPPR